MLNLGANLVISHEKYMIIAKIVLTLQRFYCMKPLRRLKKHIFIKGVCVIVGLLFVWRLAFIGYDSHTPAPSAPRPTEPPVLRPAQNAPQLPVEVVPQLDFSRRHPIFSVPSYKDCFPDVQDLQLPAALRNGVQPVRNRAEAEVRKRELLFVGMNPYYAIDPAMSSSIPYLVPKASMLLQHIARRFLDSLAVKQIPLHTIIVTSVLRTEADVARLRRINGNASEQSCHRFGTTFDISYNRFHTVQPPDAPARRAVRNDSLKFVLSEVLRDIRAEGRCYVKYEVKQGCFHITVR